MDEKERFEDLREETGNPAVEFLEAYLLDLCGLIVRYRGILSVHADGVQQRFTALPQLLEDAERSRRAAASLLSNLRHGHTIQVFEDGPWEMDKKGQKVGPVVLEMPNKSIPETVVHPTISSANLRRLGEGYLRQAELSRSKPEELQALKHVALIEASLISRRDFNVLYSTSASIKDSILSASVVDDEPGELGAEDDPTDVDDVSHLLEEVQVTQASPPPFRAVLTIVPADAPYPTIVPALPVVPSARPRIRRPWTVAASLFTVAAAGLAASYMVSTHPSAELSLPTPNSAPSGFVPAPDEAPAPQAPSTSAAPQEDPRVQELAIPASSLSYVPVMQGTVYEKVVDFVESETQKNPGSIPNVPLYVATLNAEIVDDSLYATRWQEVMPEIQDTPAAYRAITRMMERSGGFDAVLDSVEYANEAHLVAGTNKIDTPRELFDHLAHDENFPHPRAVALKVAKEAANMKDARVSANMEATLDRLDEGRMKVPFMARENPPETLTPPADFVYPKPEQADSAQDPTTLPDEERIQMSPLDAPEPLFVKAKGQAEKAAILPHAGLQGLAVKMEHDVQSLVNIARGKNRTRLPQFCADIAKEVREMAQSFNGLSVSGKEVALLCLKQKYFARLSDKETGLVRGDGSYYSAYLERYSRQFLGQLAEFLPPVDESAGVAGVQNRVKNEVLATLPEGFFRA